MIQKVSGIYCIRQTNGEGLYVGSSVDIYRRWRKHIRDLNKNKHHSPYLQNSWNKYGKDCFIFEVLEIVPYHSILNGESLISFEQCWIDKLKPCYNCCPVAGSSLGYKHTVETLVKISNTRKVKRKLGYLNLWEFIEPIETTYLDLLRVRKQIAYEQAFE